MQVETNGPCSDRLNLGKEMKRERDELKASKAFIAFLPLGSLGAYFLYGTIPLEWALLTGVLKGICFLSFFSNLLKNSPVWSILGLFAFIFVSLPAYLNTTKFSLKGYAVRKQGNHPDKVVFSELFKKCCVAILSDYRVSMVSQIPLAIQVLAAGSILYSIFGLDWIMHLAAGFSVGAVCMKAYQTAVRTYGYSNLTSYFGLDPSKTEGKWASVGWTLFCLVLVTMSWELMEQTVHLISPSNILRIGFEPLWNSTGDVIFGVLGGMTAWYLSAHSSLFESKMKIPTLNGKVGH